MMTQADIELLEQYIDGTLADDDAGRLRTLLRDGAEARAMLRSLATIDFGMQDIAATADADSRGSLREPNVDKSVDAMVAQRPTTVGERTAMSRFNRILLVIAALIIVALTASLYFQQASTQRPERITAQQPSADLPIARITGLSGPLQWTGDGGRVAHDLGAGAELSGGTIEGLTPGSWFELTFNDGSTVTISGNSTLIFSDHRQKELHLKEGTLSSNVKRQPPGKPMLIYTRSAMIEVLGTRFEVEAELAATTVNVNEGSVRVKRFSDGSTVDVPAKHRLIAAADRDMLPRPVPHSVSHWKSELSLGPVRTQGKWTPGTDTQEARLGAVPYTTPKGMTIYTTGFGVSYGDKPPVTLPPASRLRVRGRIASPQKVYFGITVRQANGAFAGSFQTIRPADELPSGQDFEVTLHLREFRLDSSLASLKQELPSAPFHLVVETIWCHTLDKQAGLEISEVELLPPAETGDRPT